MYFGSKCIRVFEPLPPLVQSKQAVQEEVCHDMQLLHLHLPLASVHPAASGQQRIHRDLTENALLTADGHVVVHPLANGLPLPGCC